MKKYSIILMAAIAVAMAGFYSCDKKTGDPDNPDNPDIPGDGSPNNPFKVVTVMDLKRVGTGEEGPGGFKWNRDKFYKQIRDIDLLYAMLVDRVVCLEMLKKIIIICKKKLYLCKN